VIPEDVMQPTRVAQQIYETSIRNLPVVERLWLVKMVMDDLMSTPATWIVDESDEWSEEDYVDLVRASLAYAARSLRE
jgi:hypothetical protein